MKHMKRLLCLILAVMMLVSVVACNDDSGEKNTSAKTDDSSGTTNNSDATSETKWEEVTDPEGIHELPELDFEGKEIKIYSKVQSVNSGEFEAVQDGNVVNEAVVERNDKLEALLNCKITSDEEVGDTNTNDVLTKMQNLAGTPTYNIVTTASYRMLGLALEGLLVDLASQEYINLQKAYYSQGYNKAVSIGERQYVVGGKMSLSWYRYQIVVMFNRTLFYNYHVDYPYQTVLQNAWDVAEMSTIASQIYNDENGDKKYDKEDLYGFYGFIGPKSSQTDGLMSSCAITVTAKDEGNYLKKSDSLEVSAVRVIVDDLTRFFNGNGAFTAGVDVFGNAGNDVVAKKFEDSGAAMIMFRLYVVEEPKMIELGRTREGYGILPLPMANKETQDDYYSYVQDQCLLFGIPNSYTGEERVMCGQFLEAFASVSYNTVKPAYYEKALTKRYVIDKESHAMLKLIDTKVYVDPVNVYNSVIGGFTTAVFRKFYDGSAEVGSTIAAEFNAEGFQTRLDQVNAKYMEIDAKLKEQGL